MPRLTTTQVDAQIDRLNKIVGLNAGAIGSYERSSAYGGHSLHRINNEYRGTTDLMRGHGPLSHLDVFVSGVIEGVLATKENDR